MGNGLQDRIRRFAAVGAIIGLILGIAVGALGFWMSLTGRAEILGMLLVSMGFPGCLLIGLLVGIFLAKR